jgi:hypothetical protein
MVGRKNDTHTQCGETLLLLLMLRRCASKFSPPGTIVRLLLPEWIKPQCSFLKDYVANPDHNR